MPKRSKTLGGRLRSERLSAGLTQSQLGDRCGIPKPTLSRYENDHVLPSLSTLRKLSGALGVSEVALIPNVEQPADYLYEALHRRGVEIRSAAEADAVAELVAQMITDAHPQIAQ